MSRPSEQQAPIGTSIDWSRLLDILQTNPESVRQLAAVEGPFAEAALEYQSSSSLSRTSIRGSWSAPGQPTDLEAGPPGEDAANQHPNHQPQPFTPSHGSQSRGALLLRQLSRRTQTPAADADHSPGADADAGSVSASAERHRLITETAGISIQAVMEWVADLIPFLWLLIWVFVFKHVEALFLIAVLTACIVQTNADIRRLIALRREARAWPCVGHALRVTALTSAVVVCTLRDTSLLRVLTLRTTQAASAMDTFLLVLLADSILRFGSLAPKLMVVAWFLCRAGATQVGRLAAGGGGGDGGGAAAGSGDAYLSGARRQRQQSRVLTAVERAVALYRTVLPGPAWYGYLLHGGGFSPVFASLFCGFYLVLKASDMATQMRLFALAMKTATRRGALYGTYVGAADSGEAGTFGGCPVCQDPVNTPVRLDCGHIFCEECILEWLERDRTCPMCRAEVRPAGLPSCSDGASPLLPQVF